MHAPDVVLCVIEVVQTRLDHSSNKREPLVSLVGAISPALIAGICQEVRDMHIIEANDASSHNCTGTMSDHFALLKASSIFVRSI